MIFDFLRTHRAFLFLVAGLPMPCLALDVHVETRAGAAPSRISIELVGSPNPQMLAWDQTLNKFTAALKSPGVIPLPYLLVAEWGESKELLYLKFSDRTDPNVRLLMLHEQADATKAALDIIDTLPNDFNSTVQRYFRARGFHRKLRYELKKPLHSQAVRSAKIWFNAAADLAKIPNSYFRMDSEAEKIMKDYEERAKIDSGFNDTLRHFARLNNVAGTLQQLAATRYSNVGEVATLVADGDLERAHKINDSALAALRNESPDVRRLVEKHQGINVELLTKNSAFIATKRSALAN